MLTQTHQKYRLILMVSDTTGILLSWLLSYYLRFHTNIIPVTKGIPQLAQYAALSVPIVLVWISVFGFLGVYGPDSVLRSVKNFMRFARAHLVAFLCFMALTYLLSEYRFSRVALLYFGVLSGICLILVRLVLAWAFRAIRSMEPFQRKTLVVGYGATAMAIATRIQRHPELGLSLQGFLNSSGGGSDEKAAPVLGRYEDILAIVEKQGIAQIIIALPRSEAGNQDAVLRALTKAVVDVRLVPDIQEYMVLGCFVEEFDGFPIVTLNEAPIDFIGMVLKRWVDILFSMLALVLLSPLLVCVALLVKCTSRGPIFYGQDRMGLDGVTFTMWKFRSMRVDAESESGPVWAKPNDDRRTPIGAILRASSIDELPQFWNVLRGEMSLVGPRPERPQFVDKFRSNMPTYMYRHKVKAGLTGWAQINGWRGDTSLEKRIEYDLYYIRHWSLFLDLKILFLTPFKGIINKNAY